MTIHLSHKMNHMNESVTIKVLSPSSKGKMPLYVNTLMSSRSYSYEKIGIIWIELGKERYNDC